MLNANEQALYDLCMSDSAGRAQAIANYRGTDADERRRVGDLLESRGWDARTRMQLAFEELEKAGLDF